MAVTDHDQPLDPEHDAGRGRAFAGPPRFDRLVRSPAARRLSSRRLLIGLLASGAVGWGVYEGGTRGSSALGRWIAAQPEYQIRFDEITLNPPPPPYVLRGAAGILDRVRREGKYAATVSALGLDLDRLRLDLKRNYWIERVDGVRSSYRRLTVDVAYRRPVALIVYWDEATRQDVGDLIDRHGVELPELESEIAWAERRLPHWRPLGMAQPLVEIRNMGRGRRDRTGLTWRPLTVRPEESPDDDSRVQQAAHLAEFLLTRQATTTPRNLPYPSFTRIVYDRSLAGFYLTDAQCHRVDWGVGPGDESPEEPQAAEKWAILGRYIDQHGSLVMGREEALRLRHSGATIRQLVGPQPMRPAPNPTTRR